MTVNKDDLITTCKCLPFKVDTERLNKEITLIPEAQWNSDRGSVHVDANAVFVKGFSPTLRKPDEDQPILQALPYLRSIIYNLLPGAVFKCVIAKLKPGGYVRMHRDGWVDDPETNPDTYFYDYFHNTIRFHIPVVTNPGAIFFVNGEFFHMPAGEVWAINNTNDHAAMNHDHFQARTHIIFDKEPVPELLDMLQNLKPVAGWQDRELLFKLVQDSQSPLASPYAAGKILQ